MSELTTKQLAEHVCREITGVVADALDDRLSTAIETLEAVLMVRGWFEGNPDGALEEIEVRTRKALAQMKGES